ncbi:MAG TPA: class I SAM-dependent methyltransferase [Myxococcota bacterium]|nr:class I SAM-dependent methyltransferase [Myxococcota bacterium]HRY94551.1 class I SAM-dependent methyltransferase [Myxococcota bacterium]HSA22384.1 class I SAM-dependent methyltransferase [Myxococcota bacterium]
MRPGTASRTAEYAAAFRALESVRRPASARLFEDPFAVHFLDAGLRRFVWLAGLPAVGPAVFTYVDRRWPGAMTSGIARTRLIDDHLRAALRAGIAQVVLLGAGFDCRAHRLPELAACPVFEVDHPDTQTRKRACLARRPTPPRGQVSYVGADLAREELGGVLRASGLDARAPALVVWEGVTHYLGAQAVDASLRALAGLLAPGSRLVFTYLHRGLLAGSAEFADARTSREQVARDGEPWIFGLEPAELPAFLEARGLALREDLGAEEYRARCWGERGRRMRGFRFYRVALAEVPPAH